MSEEYSKELDRIHQERVEAGMFDCFPIVTPGDVLNMYETRRKFKPLKPDNETTKEDDE